MNYSQLRPQLPFNDEVEIVFLTEVVPGDEPEKIAALGLEGYEVKVAYSVKDGRPFIVMQKLALRGRPLSKEMNELLFGVYEPQL